MARSIKRKATVRAALCVKRAVAGSSLSKVVKASARLSLANPVYRWRRDPGHETCAFPEFDGLRTEQMPGLEHCIAIVYRGDDLRHARKAPRVIDRKDAIRNLVTAAGALYGSQLLANQSLMSLLGNYRSDRLA